MKRNMSTSGLRVRPSPRSGNRQHEAQQRIKKECQSALLPVFVIAAVWSLGCWFLIWVRLYQTFTDDLTKDPRGNFGNKRYIDVLKLKQILDRNASAVKKVQSLSAGVNLQPESVLERLIDDENSKQVQQLLMSYTQYPQLILGAFLEPSQQKDDSSLLELRTHVPGNLTYASYPYKKSVNETNVLGACSQNGAQLILPTFHPPNMDHYFGGNVFRKQSMFDKRWDLAIGIDTKSTDLNSSADYTRIGYCPVDADPFLPWLHDVFPSRNGLFIEFIIPNKRRCNTDSKVFQSDLINLEPQVALMQPLPLKRVEEDWNHETNDGSRRNWTPSDKPSYISPDTVYKSPRYVLATSISDADEDAKFTRFVCRFHTVSITIEGAQKKLKEVILGETLSTYYPYNPERANDLKQGSKPMLTSLEQGHDEQIWNSVYSIRCPVPALSDGIRNLTSIIASGASVSHPNGVPSIYVDLVPIRTPVRKNKEAFGFPRSSYTLDDSTPFDPKLSWGGVHKVPPVESSGRWINIPICTPPSFEQNLTLKANINVKESTQSSLPKKSNPITDRIEDKPHFLVGCVWASHSFSTRGESSPTDASTSNRLLEFLAYHIHIAGFDHIYVYDNSDTSSDNINMTLAPITNLFSSVTRIPWPHRICNNNRPTHSNPGERSSQYAAESSCRARYGPDTEWLISMDVDEYLIPVNKKWPRISDWLRYVTETENDTKILSFFQTRALPNIDDMIPYNETDIKSCKAGTRDDEVLNATCVMKDPKKTYMETYNCEPTKHPKPQNWAWRAKKQIYKPEFVWNHFVHYSVVTRLVNDKPEVSPRFHVRAPYERRVNELTEGFMLHAKTTSPEMTLNWQSKCSRNENPTKSSCHVGVPSIEILGTSNATNLNEAVGARVIYEPNCFRHSRVMELIPKLEKVIRSLISK